MINKLELSATTTQQIEAFCLERHYTVVARLHYDPEFILAMVNGKAITDYFLVMASPQSGHR